MQNCACRMQNCNWNKDSTCGRQLRSWHLKTSPKGSKDNSCRKNQSSWSRYKRTRLYSKSTRGMASKGPQLLTWQVGYNPTLSSRIGSFSPLAATKPQQQRPNCMIIRR